MAAVATVLIVLCSAPTSQGRVVPPENSAANQYTEAFPTWGGDQPTGDTADGRSRTPDEVLGKAESRRLKALGPDGRAAAELAAATAPSSDAPAPPSPRGNGETSQDNGAGSGLTHVIGEATGASSSGAGGPILLIVVLVVLAGSAAYLWRGRLGRAG